MLDFSTVVRRCVYLLALALLCVSFRPTAADSVRPADGDRRQPEKAPLKKPPAEKASLAEMGPKPKPAPPPKPEALEGAIRRGVEFLLRRQNKDGSWGSAHNTTGMDVYAPAPGAHHAFRTAVTSLCICALIETGETDPRVPPAIDRGEAWLLEHLPALRRATPDAIYNNWGHAYSIQALAKMYDRRPQDQARRTRIREQMEQQLRMLERYECVDGGWCYYDFNAHTQQPSGSSISFVSATALIALAAKSKLAAAVLAAAGLTGAGVEAGLIALALAALEYLRIWTKGQTNPPPVA